jgi:hypothetical protein
MSEEHPTDPGFEMAPGDQTVLSKRYTAQEVLAFFKALGLPVSDDHSAITQTITRERRQREQDSLSADPSLRRDAAAWLNAAPLLGEQPRRRELLVLLQEEVNRMLSFRLERYGQANKAYTPDLRDDLKAAAIRGFLLSDDLAERFMRAFEHGCELRYGARVPLTLRSFSVWEVATQTFDSTLTTLLPPMPSPDVPPSIPQGTAPMPAIRPKRPATKVSAPLPTPERKVSAPLLMPSKAASRLVLNGSAQPEEWPLTKDTIAIGRTPDSDLCLKEDGRVSRQHAVIHRAPTAFILTDLNSSNGTFVNGAPITEPTVLHPGDQIRVGHTELTFIMEPLEQPQDH